MSIGPARATAALVAALALGIAGSASESPLAAAAGAANDATCNDARASMVFGYFDHTGAWYRQRGFREDQAVAYHWRPANGQAVVVLYNDVSRVRVKEVSAEDLAAAVRDRIQARETDIAGYLEQARKNGHVKVLLQVPPDIVSHWDKDPALRGLLAEFVKRWASDPALAGFYLFDEPELAGIPTATLANAADMVRKHAATGGATVAISVASSAVAANKPILREFASASPRIFDQLLVNRYPINRAYRAASRAPGKAGASTDTMAAKLGLAADKAQREGLADNEFANLSDYYDSLVASTRVPNLAGRPIFASMQAFGLRDDCDGANCKVLKERNPSRSPTWNELLYMLTSIWMSGNDGAVLYSRYFALYDTALTKRLANLEDLMAVYGRLPGCGSVATVLAAGARGRAASGAPDGILARFARAPGSTQPSHVIVLHDISGESVVRVLFDRKLPPVTATELRFDTQGNPAASSPVTMDRSADAARQEMQIRLQGHGAKIFRLRYD